MAESLEERHNLILDNSNLEEFNMQFDVHTYENQSDETPKLEKLLTEPIVFDKLGD